eukprot:TRINITY_DN36742_c0_g1_i1.p1 TRINITY_DN36742_c0_g1~~TRINITY_DN36742_c0_g1_i1.p1  ORF type:complete len:356 (+),score=41.51 TRINITY_DN36742_c0_g1_i1:60-1070(+)
MNATLWTAYGSPRQVLQYGTAAKPSPKPSEVLIEVHAAAVHAGDWHVIRGDPKLVRLQFGMCAPSAKYRVPGMDMAGKVVAVGAQVTRFRVGDEVYGDLSAGNLGAFGEFVTVNEKTGILALKPAESKCSFEEAAACPVSAITALQALRDMGKVQQGQRVLVVGASGGVGHFAVQMAKRVFNAGSVTAVCSASKMDMVRGLGADQVVDYNTEDVTKSPASKPFDCIIDAGAYRPFFDYAPILTATGRYVLVGGSTANLLKVGVRGQFWSEKGGKQFLPYLVKPNVDDLQNLTGMIEEGLVKPVIGCRFALANAAEAVACVDEGKAEGKVVVQVIKG